MNKEKEKINFYDTTDIPGELLKNLPPLNGAIVKDSFIAAGQAVYKAISEYNAESTREIMIAVYRVYKIVLTSKDVHNYTYMLKKLGFISNQRLRR